VRLTVLATSSGALQDDCARIRDALRQQGTKGTRRGDRCRRQSQHADHLLFFLTACGVGKRDSIECIVQFGPPTTRLRMESSSCASMLSSLLRASLTCQGRVSAGRARVPVSAAKTPGRGGAVQRGHAFMQPLARRRAAPGSRQQAAGSRQQAPRPWLTRASPSGIVGGTWGLPAAWRVPSHKAGPGRIGWRRAVVPAQRARP